MFNLQKLCRYVHEVLNWISVRWSMPSKLPRWTFLKLLNYGVQFMFIPMCNL